MNQKEKFAADGIIFDVDGTLWDSTAVVAKAWNEELQKDGTPYRISHPAGGAGNLLTAADLKHEFGKPLLTIIRDLLPDLGEDAQKEMLIRWFTAEDEALAKNPPSVYPGLPEALQALRDKNIACFVVSNCQAGYIEQFYADTGLEAYFADHLCEGDNDLPKADNIRLMADRHHCRHAFYVGDIQADLDATRKAAVMAGRKIGFVWASYGFGTADAPDAVIRDIRELPELFLPCNSRS